MALSYADYMASVRPLPVVEMDVTRACNNRCTICGEGWANRVSTPRDPSRDTLRERMRVSFGLGARRILLKGGEPTLRADLGEIARDAREAGFEHLFVFTNARLAASAAGERRLASLGASGFHVSVQGGTKERHDAAVQAEGAFGETTEGLRRLVGSGQLVLVNSVLTTHLLADLEAYVSLMLEIRPSEVGFDTVKPGGLVDTLPGRLAARLGLRRHVRPGEVVDFGEVSPLMTAASARLADAMEALLAAGIPATLSSFPPCLLPPGREHLAGGMEDGATLVSAEGSGPVRRKTELLDRLREKGTVCASCACDDTCPGVYRAYARAHGLAELRPLTVRPHRPEAARMPAGDREGSPIARLLREAFAGGPAPLATAFEASGDGRFRLRCEELDVVLDPDLAAPAYRRTALFSVAYVGTSATASQLLAVDGLVARLEELAPSMAPLPAPPTASERDENARGKPLVEPQDVGPDAGALDV